ncbi:MAG: DUF2330 domain-containing protein, partial [Polyangiales bacterium]
RPMKSLPGHLSVALLLLFTCRAALHGEASARACAIAAPEGIEISLATERVAIVWDAERGRQHFVRDASFRGGGEFGFLVPTPAMPELSEADEAILDRLQVAMQRERVTENEYVPMTCCTVGYGMMLSGAAPTDDALAPSLASPGVEVVGTQRVGDLDASILRINDAEALPAWLRDNGFDLADSILDWARPYAADGYFLTAFKFDPERDGTAETSAFQTGAIRVSFDAEQPFYPYREPAGAGGEARSLQVYFLADERARGYFKDGDDSPFGSIFYADNVPSLIDTPQLADLGVDEGTWLTVFNDTASTRAAYDVFFDVAQGSVIHPPPIVTRNSIPIPIPLEIIAALGLVWVWRRRKNASAAA